MSRKATIILIAFLILSLIPTSSFHTPTHAQVPEVKYLVVLFEFEDLNHTKSVEEMRSITIDQVQAYYDEVSYGKIRVIGEFIPRWIKIPYKVNHLNLFQWSFNSEDMWKIDNKARDLCDQLIGGVEYSTRFIVYAGKVWGHAYSAWKMTFQNEFYGASVYCHELGHVLGLPDLYSYVASQQGKYSGANVGYWDLMAHDRYQHFCSWSKVKLGWIEKPQIVDIKDKFQGTFIIDAIENRTARLLLVRVHLSETLAYYVEVRARLGVDAKLDRRMRMGVLILLVNGLLDPKEGGVVVVDSHPNSYSSSTPWAELFDAPFSVGRNETVALISRERNLSVIVLSKIGHSCKIMLGDVATGEKAIEANNIIAQAEDAVSKAEKESRLKGLDDARSQLTKANNAYSSAQFPDAISAAKTTIELANAATKMPIVTSTPVTETVTPTRTETAVTPFLPSSTVVLAIVGIVALVAVGALLMLRRGKKPVSVISSLSTPSKPATKYCIECGKEMSPDENFCKHCGARQVS